MTIRNNINFIKKDLKWHDKKRGNKKVIINKHDNFNANVGDNVYFINQNDFEILDNAISDYETQIKKLENDLKTSKKIYDKNYENNIYEIKEKHHQELEQLQHQHQQELDKIKEKNQQEIKEFEIRNQQALDKLKDETNQLKQSNIESITKIKDNHNQELKEQHQQHQQALDKLNDEIKQLQHQHNQDIKQYQELHQQALDKQQELIKEQKDLIKELNDLKAHEFDYAIKYNDLRQAIKNISWIGAIRNKHKGLLNEYPIIPLSDKQTKYLYDVNTSDNKQ